MTYFYSYLGCTPCRD